MKAYDDDLVSVITPNYNSARFIEESMISVLRQTYQRWELVIADDLSDDGGYEIIKRFELEDKRIRPFRMEGRSGAAASRNAAIKRARGRYIAMLDSDDVWLPEKLEKQLELLEKTKSAVVYSYYEKITEHGERNGRIIRSGIIKSYPDLLKTNSIGNLTAVIDRKISGDIEIPNIPAHEDYALWLSLAKKGCKFACLPEVTAFYRCRADSLSAKKWKVARSQWHIYRKIEKLPLLLAIYYFIQYFMNGLAKAVK
jgi:teichuronic acid biosynthesis glycosyltransferase TuaG